jgi:predicted RNase H-like nuclease (RuvC/YqgF family)
MSDHLRTLMLAEEEIEVMNRRIEELERENKDLREAIDQITLHAPVQKHIAALEAERDALRARAKAAEGLREALGHYTNAEIVTDWGMEETEDDGEIARAALDAYRRGQGE